MNTFTNGFLLNYSITILTLLVQWITPEKLQLPCRTYEPVRMMMNTGTAVLAGHPLNRAYYLYESLGM
jgi:hypothetical protein